MTLAEAGQWFQIVVGILIPTMTYSSQCLTRLSNLHLRAYELWAHQARA